MDLCSQDGEPDAVEFRSQDQSPTGFWIDLLGANGDTSQYDVGDAAKDPVRQEQWKHQFALVLHPYPTAFYDADGDGQFDLIVQAPLSQDGAAAPTPDVQWRRTEDEWAISPISTPRRLMDGGWFSDPKLRESFETVTRTLEKALRQSRPSAP